MSEIGFDVGGSDSDEEIPPVGDDGERARLRRLRLRLGLAVAVLVGALLAARAVSSGGGSSHSALPASPSPTAPATHSYGTAPDSGSGLLNGMATGAARAEPPRRGPADPAQCPGSFRCFSVFAIPAPVRAAVRAAFPGATVTAVGAVYLDVRNYGQALWYLRVDARSGADDIALHLQSPRRSDTPHSGVEHTGSRVITYYEADLLQYHVVVRVDAPAAHPMPVASLRQLAADSRLIVRS